jgi:glycosyltransferase involved in cell wall biosynthesis
MLRLSFAGRDQDQVYKIFAKQGKSFSQAVARALAKEQFSTYFGFSGASLEALEFTKEKGRLAVLDEIAPTHLEDSIVLAEQRRFPRWEPKSSITPDSYLRRIEAEWAMADRIVVNSVWSRDAIVAHGADRKKIQVVPISYESPNPVPEVKSLSQGETLRVLWLGTLNLRKGLPYALEAARMLEDAPVQFTFAGPSVIDLSRALPLPRNAVFLGQVPRAEVGRIWEKHHVFLLPTLSDGFAITQIEAMAHALPVIATENCGSVVESNRSGLIVPPRDPIAIADAIRVFIDGRLDLAQASAAALVRAKEFNPDALWPSLRKVLTP